MTTTGQYENSSFEDVSAVLDQLSAWLETQAVATRRYNGLAPTARQVREGDPVAVRLGARAVHLVPRLLRVLAGMARVLAVALRAGGRSAARSRGDNAPSKGGVRAAAALTSRGVIRSLRSAVPAHGPNGDAPVAEPLEPEVREELVDWVESEAMIPADEPEPAADEIEPAAEESEEPAAVATPPPAPAEVPPEWPRPTVPAPSRSSASMVKLAVPVTALVVVGLVIWRRRRR